MNRPFPDLSEATADVGSCVTAQRNLVSRTACFAAEYDAWDSRQDQTIHVQAGFYAC